MAKPTHSSYSELQAVYDLFNKKLFGGKLPDCLLTLQPRDRRIAGYFSSKRFQDENGRVFTDELAMNPTYFHAKPIDFALQTLGHEMVHVWQAHFGEPGRRGYHNKEWGTIMKKIGLYPSSTGQPGGKEVGEHMSDYIIEGGPIAGLIARLIKQGFKLSWSGRRPVVQQGEGGNGQGDGEDEGEGEGQSAPNRTKRVKFTCPKCAANAWGKPTLKIVCGVCQKPFEAGA